MCPAPMNRASEAVASQHEVASSASARIAFSSKSSSSSSSSALNDGGITCRYALCTMSFVYSRLVAAHSRPGALHACAAQSSVVSALSN